MNLEDYKIAYENVMVANKMLVKEIERLNNIIKEAREYIEERYNGEVLTHTFDKDNVGELLEILGSEKGIYNYNSYDGWRINIASCNDDIKSIVTKEQFESMEYKIGE